MIHKDTGTIKIQGQDVVEADVRWLRGLTFLAIQSAVSVLSDGGGSIFFFISAKQHKETYSSFKQYNRIGCCTSSIEHNEDRRTTPGFT